METNEQGLTIEEKIMFSILGIILIIAVGVLIINSFSENERKLDDNETPITENKDGKDNVKDETNTNGSDSSLIEDTTEESKPIYNSKPTVSKKPSTSTKPTYVVSKPKPKPTSPIIKDDLNGTGSTQPSVTLAWDFKDTVVVEAYDGDEIIIEEKVILENGEERTAAVTLRKQEGNCYNIIDISSGKVTVTAGVYKYYYTYGDVTKELLLIVKDNLPVTSIEFLKLKETYVTDSSFSEADYNLLKETITASELKLEGKIHTLTLNKKSKEPIIMPLVLKFKEDMTEKLVVSDTKGVTTKNTNEVWHEELTPNDIILLVDTSTIDFNNNKIAIYIDGVEYVLYLNIIENIIETPPVVTPDNEEDNKDDETVNPDNNEEDNNEKNEIVDNTTEEDNDDEKLKPTPDEDESSTNDLVAEEENDSLRPTEEIKEVEEKNPNNDISQEEVNNNISNEVNNELQTESN